MEVLVDDGSQHLASDDEGNLDAEGVENLGEFYADVATSDDNCSSWELFPGEEVITIAAKFCSRELLLSWCTATRNKNMISSILYSFNFNNFV